MSHLPADFHRRLEYGAALPSALNGITRLSSDRVAELFTRWVAARQQHPPPKGDPLGMNEEFLLCLDAFERGSAPAADIDEAQLARLAERGAVAWAGVTDDDIRALREGSAPSGEPLSDAEAQALWVGATIERTDMRSVYLRGLRDGERAHGIAATTAKG